jgi:hypothetical protein
MATTRAYPVTFEVEPQIADRNRVTTFFRIILAIPHLFLVGGPGLAGGGGTSQQDGALSAIVALLTFGVLAFVAGIMTIISWFAIVITGKDPRGLWDFRANVMRWRGRSNAYIALLRDEYPPFAFEDAGYPSRVVLNDYPQTRNRMTVLLRLFFLIPHVIVLIFLDIAWAVTLIIAWFAILITGSYPEGLYNFAVGVMRWHFRLEAYGTLLNDEFPPFSLSE